MATVGPASDSPGMLDRPVRAGRDVARPSFSRGGFEGHAARIARLRAAKKAAGRRIAMPVAGPSARGPAASHRIGFPRPGEVSRP